MMSAGGAGWMGRREVTVADKRLKTTGKALVGFLLVMLVSLLSACGTPPASPSSAPVWQAAEVPSRLSPEQASDVTIYALGLVGTPYRYGGNTPESGFDCSGLIGHVYKTRGDIGSPRTVSLLRDWGQAINAEQLRSGDLVVFLQIGVATHAGIYVGAGRFVHAPSAGGKVRLDLLSARYWASQAVVFRRP